MLRPENIFCHETFDDGVFIFIEDNLFNGWIASKYKINELLLGTQKVVISDNLRQDVIDEYATQGIIIQEAWEVQFPISDSSQAFDPLYVKYNSGTSEVTSKLGTLEKFYVYGSGFHNTDAKEIIVVDNFYEDPMAIRNFAINNLQFEEKEYHRGLSTAPWTLFGTQEKFEKILGTNILDWNNPNLRNGQFQYVIGSDPIVHHVDENIMAGMVYLTPDAPFDSGTSLYQSKISEKRKYDPNGPDTTEYEKVFNDNFYSRYKFTETDRIGNVFNRLVLFNSFNIHSATQHFGATLTDARFFHIFFFNVEF